MKQPAIQDLPHEAEIIYPESDGLPMADNTEQAEWMSMIFWAFRALYRHNPDVFVAMNLFWYPVKGQPGIRTAPDVFVAFGRPKGRRGSYQQWKEGDIPPQVVIEVMSPGNTPEGMEFKREWYERYGVEEYFVIDPDLLILEVFHRKDGVLQKIMVAEVYQSPRLKVTFDLSEKKLIMRDEQGNVMQSPEELVEDLDEAIVERDEAVADRDAIAEERDAIAKAHDAIAAERDRLIAQLKALGIDPK